MTVDNYRGTVKPPGIRRRTTFLLRPDELIKKAPLIHRDSPTAVFKF